jgi:uncharacterized protein (TIGR04255 family)
MKNMFISEVKLETYPILRKMAKENETGLSVLKNPPIIEALLELKWEVGDQQFEMLDKKFKLYPGIFSEKIKQQYPEIEILDGARIPDEMNPYIPRYRFRKQPNGYPLVQIGPGVLTVNLDKGFSRELFYEACKMPLDILFDILPNLTIIELTIHYIDAFNFSFETNPFEYLNKKLKTNFEFSTDLFSAANANPNPVNFNLDSTYKVTQPDGYLRVQIHSGVRKADNLKLLLMDTIFFSIKGQIPSRSRIPEWIKNADNVLHSWFYKMIEKSGIE